MEVGSRTRTGCWACRDRSVKCDGTTYQQQRPICRKCRRMGLKCTYGVRLTWIEDSLARGVCHGREAVTRRKHRKNESFHDSRPADRRYSMRNIPASSPHPVDLHKKSTARTKWFFLNTAASDIIPRYLGGFPSLSNGDYQLDYARTSCSPEADSEHAIESLEGADDLTEIAGLDREYTDTSDDKWLGANTRLNGRWPMMPDSLSTNDSYVLDFFEAAVCAKATMFEGREHNPLRHIILPMAFSSSRVYHGVLAVAANKLAATQNSYNIIALSHRQQVLMGVRQLLTSMNSNPIDYVEALASVVLLCWFEISDSCQPAWVNHLFAIRALLDVCDTNLTGCAYAEDVLRYCEQYFTYHLVMAKTLFRVHESKAKPERDSDPGDLNPLTCLLPLRRGLDSENVDHIEASQGFSNSLLLLINEICDMRNLEPVQPGCDESPMIAAKVSRIQTGLENLNQLLPRTWSRGCNSHSTPRDSHYPDSDPDQQSADIPEMHTFKITSEVNRLGALLFLDETCALYWPAIVPLSRERRELIIDDIIELSSHLDVGCITAAYPIWPLFIAGCLVPDDDRRLLILEIFERLESVKDFRNYPPARTVIEMVWRQRDLTCDENPRTASSRRDPFRLWRSLGSAKPDQRQCTQYAWEQAMSMLGGWRLSLT